MSTAAQALEYRKLGFSVIPLGVIAITEKGGKNISYPVPWKKYQTQIATEKELTEWFEVKKYPNMGIITGKISNLFVLDTDSYKEGYDAELVRSFNLPVTPVQTTGRGGKQYFFRYSGDATNAVGVFKKESCIDIRANGGMVIVPPSKNYSWDISPFDEPLAQLPPLLEKLFEKEVKEKKSLPDVIDVNHGGRDSAMASFAGKLMRALPQAEWAEEVYSAMVSVNKTYNPPLTADDLKRIYESIASKETARVEKEDRSSELAEQEEKDIRAEFVKNKTKATYRLAQYLTKKFNIITVGEKEREMSVYSNGIYRRAENEIIYPEIQRVLGEHINKSAKLETFHKIADMTSFPRTVFDSAAFNLIPLKNGVYDMNTKVLLPHDPKYRFTYQFPIIHDINAQCPKSEEFINNLFDEEYRNTMQEWLGYYFYRLYLFKKAVILVGEGDTGKTTFLEMVIHLLGKDNISGVSLQKMSSDKFSAAHLYGRHGNLVDELSAKDITDTGAFKVATGGGSISGEYKFGNQFSFCNFSKFTFACNRIPDVKDFDDEAYFMRWMVIRFENPITKKVPNFIQTLTTEEERSGLFNYAMVGLERLLANGGFTAKKTAMDTKLEMMRSGSSIAVFAAERVQQEVGKEMSKEDMYDAYTAFCVENGLAAETIKMFGTKFSFYVSYVTDGLINVLDNRGKPARVRGWRNVSVIPTEKKDDNWDKI